MNIVVLRAAWVVVAVSFVAGCEGEHVDQVQVFYKIVDGTPAIDPALPTIDDQAPVVDPDIFRNNAPEQTDVFLQKTVRKVDILWVVDNSCSMLEEQQNLATSFGSFITDLTRADPPVDYHLGIITTDAAAEGGALRPLATDATKRYIACNEDGIAGCNVLDEALAFEQTIAVGTGGGAIEKGLLAAHLALTDPMKSTVNAGFLRDEAALYVVVVSDEGDASCDPILAPPPGTDLRTCSFTPFCTCGDTATGYGSPEYFTRFLEGLKGYGNDDLVALAAIVATEQDNLVIDGNMYLGCSGAGGEGLYAPRYVQVANDTGGITTSVCDADFSGALSALGFAVSGQRLDFQLSRRPADPTLVPAMVEVQSDPADATTRRTIAESSVDGWTYVLCESGTFTNVIRFSGSEVPPPKARIFVTYQVDVDGGTRCTP